MNKRLRVIVPVVVILAATTWYLARGTTSESDALFASGSVEATTADLGFQQPGRVGQITVSEGTSVAAGQELARLETGELEATLAAAEAQVAAAQARLSELVQGSRPEEIMASEAAARSADRRRENARLDHERARELFEGGAVSRQALDQAETALEVAEAAYDQAAQALVLVREGPRTETVGAQRALVAQARANVARVRATLENARVLAPFDGVITVKHRQAGEIVPAGAPVVTLLDRDDRWVRIYVREDEIGRVQIGQRAEIASDTYPDRVYEGEVVFIGSEAEFTPRNVQTAEERIKLVYPVKVRITNDPGFELKPGVPADVTITERPS